MHNPYKELASYLEIDAAQFKGRTAEIEEMYKSFYQNEYLVCYADSGEGKSSIIEAGLVPKLRQNIYLPIHIVFKSDRHFLNSKVDFDEVICNTIDEELGRIRNENLAVSVEYPIRLSELEGAMAPWEKDLIEQSAWLRLRYSRINIETLVYTPVLIFDQFEEVFTNPSSQEWTDRFFAWLEELSADVLPERVKETLKVKYGEDDFPEIQTQKGYKCIFSLRSEYIGKLDYWCMQRHFIPQLKSNRYLLRPLTSKGAREVITQQKGYNGLDNVADRIISLLRARQRGKNYVSDEASDLPCIPALFLSVICSQAFDMTDDQRREFIAQLSMSNAGDKSSAIDGIVERFYEKTIAQCGIPQNVMERIEDVLVNSEGNRQRVSSQTDVLKAIDFSGKYLPILEEARIIRVIPEYNRDDKSIELIHDSLCPVIQKRKEQRLKQIEEEARKLKTRNEEILCSAFLAGLFMAIVGLVYALLQVDEFWVIFEMTKFPKNILFANILLFPFLIIGAIKRLKQWSWLSLYGLVSNAILSYFFLSGQQEELGLRIGIVVLSMVVPMATSVCAVKYRLFGRAPKSEKKVIANSLPLHVFWLAGSIFGFLLCVLNTKMGFPQPMYSCWGLLVIPILAHEVIRRMLHVSTQWNAFLPYCVSLGLLALNSLIRSFPLPFIGLCAVLCGCVLALIGTYRGLSGMKRMACVSAESIIIVLLVVLNLGFDFNKIDYDEVDRVNSWHEVIIKNRKGKYGILSACYGDTIVPAMLDSIGHNWKCYLTSNKIRHKEHKNIHEFFYQYSAVDSTSHLQYYVSPTWESRIFSFTKDSTAQNQVLHCAAVAVRDVRLATLNYFKTGQWYSIEDVSSLKRLIKLQEKELDGILTEMKDSTVNSTNLLAFYIAFARSFYTAMLENRIRAQDPVHIYFFSQNLAIPYFYNYVPDRLSYVYSINNVDDLVVLNRSIFDIKDFRKGNLEIWHDFMYALFAFNKKYSIPEYADAIKAQSNWIMHQNDGLLHALNRQTAKAKSDNQSSSELLNELIDHSTAKSISNAGSLQTLVNRVFDGLHDIVINQNTLFQSALINLCAQLFLVDKLYRHADNEDLAKKLRDMYNKESPLLQELKQVDDRLSDIQEADKLIHDILNKKDQKN